MTAPRGAAAPTDAGTGATTHAADGRRLLVVMGQERFSDQHGWGEMMRHWPQPLAGRVEVEAVPVGGLARRITSGSGAPDVVVPIMSPLPAAAIEAGGFGLVQQFGAGVEAIDVRAATAAGVWVANMAGLNAVPVAEHAITLLLALLRRLPEAARGFEPGRWGEPAGRSLATCSITVVGLGAVGTAVTERLTAWGATVVGVHRGTTPPSAAAGLGIRTASADDARQLHRALAGADGVVIAASHRRGRAPVIDGAAIAAMRPGAHLVNVARAGLLDHDALLRALDTGHLASAALDVFPHEPATLDDPVVRHPRVLATAHTAALTSDVFTAAATRLGQALQSFSRGQPPTDLLNPTVTRPRRKIFR